MVKYLLNSILALFPLITSAQAVENKSEKNRADSVGAAVNYKPFEFYFTNQQISINDKSINQPLEKVDKRDLKDFNELMRSARNTFLNKQFEACYLLLKGAEENGIVNKEFYMLLGLTTYYYIKEKKTATLYFLRGNKKFDCRECQQVIALL